MLLTTKQTDANGEFRVRTRVPGATIRLGAAVEIATGACTEPSTAPGGCLTQTTAAPAERTTRLVIPRKTDAKRAIRGRDQALARRSTLAVGDFPAGWDVDPGDLVILDLCMAQRPDLSALTVTGETFSATFSSMLGTVSSMATVFATTSQARTAFGASATTALAKCIAKEITDSDVVLRGVGPIRFSALGDATRAFRMRFDYDGRRIVVDLVFARVQRVVLQLAFISNGGQTQVEQGIAAKVAARASLG